VKKLGKRGHRWPACRNRVVIGPPDQDVKTRNVLERNELVRKSKLQQKVSRTGRREGEVSFFGIIGGS